MDNPFQINYPDHTDVQLVTTALTGDKEALQHLIIRHQVFVYNLALKMTKNVQDAEDLVQEVFIKAITALSKFENRSQFRTWLYRMAVNHFLNTKKRKTELQITGFENYFDSIDNIPESGLTQQEQKEWSSSIEETRISCTAGMLLCLDRQQRIVYILGEMFGIDHNLGAEILGTTAGNFRIRLMRARKDLYNWMNERCGLINKANPCRCAKKTRANIEAGYVDPNNLQFNTRYKKRIYELSEKNAEPVANTFEDLYKNIFQQHPLQEPLSASRIVDEVFNNNLVKLILNV